MKIEYYVLNNWNRYDFDAGELKFSSVERIKKYILESYKFDPHLSIPKHKFTGLEVCEPFVIVQEYYKIYKTGPNKGQFVLDKNGQKIVIDKEEIETTKIVADYSNYDLLRHEFEVCNFKRDGYYELSYEVQPVVETDEEITFSAQVFISFVTATKEFTPEIKTPGVPYQESKTVIKEIARSPKYPLRICQDKYGLLDNLDAWYKPQNCFVVATIGWNKEVLEILD